MKEKKKYLYCIIGILLITISSLVFYQTYSKYVLSDKKVGFRIGKLMEDKVKSTIVAKDPTPQSPDEAGINLTDERYYTNQDVHIDYDDNIKVGTAKYWYNEDDEIFEGEGKDFENGTIFSEEG